MSLFISATNVHTGRLRIFPQDKVSADVIMASACLPFLFRAVEIDGVPYWDGGYMGNPAIFPFFRATETEDVLIVQINPVERPATPHTQTEIMNRINEITFNSSLLAEFRAIDFVTRMIDQGRLPHGTAPGEYRRINVHRIALELDVQEADRRLEAQFGFRFLPDAAQGRPARGAGFPHCAFRRHRRALDGRSRRGGEGRVGVVPPREAGRVPSEARRVGSAHVRSPHPARLLTLAAIFPRFPGEG